MNKKENEKNNQYQIKPKTKQKFKPNKAQEIIKEILSERLSEQKYSEVQGMNKDIGEHIKYKLKEVLGLQRYKYLVQVTLGEQLGQGVTVAGKCFWDYETDYTVSHSFLNNGIYCLVVVYAIYLY